MLTYLKGDLFNSPAQVLVNTVNTVGVMGKGIALEFKNRYPEMFKVYQKICEDKSLDIGNLLLWKNDDKLVLLFPTKKHWRSSSKLTYIEDGLKKFVLSYESLGIESIAFPRLGCDNGGLNWDEVKPIMDKHLKNLPIRVYIYLDKYEDKVPVHNRPLEIENWERNNTDSIGFALIKEDLQKAIKLKNEFLINSSEMKYISWESEEIHLISGNDIIIKGEELCDFWNYIRDVGVIDIDKLPTRFINYGRIMLDILKRLDYVQPIMIVSNGGEDIKNTIGYQYIYD